MGHRNLIWRFLTDDRGSETAEFGIVALVIACSSVRGLRQIDQLMSSKMDAFADQIDAAG